MGRRRLAIIPLAILTAVAVNVSLAVTPAAAKPARPSKITAVSTAVGGRPGQAVIRWSTAGKNTDYFLLETGLTAFSPTSTSMPRHGRYKRVFKIARTARAYVLNTAAAGAPVGSGRHVYLRLFAVNQDGSAYNSRPFPNLRAVLPRGQGAKSRGTWIRAASFNVRTANATTDKRTWPKRVSDVAAEIMSRRPGVAMLQELGPGRADGRKIPLGTSQRQTTSLLSALKRIGGGSYRLVRSTPLIRPGILHGSQGARILYNSSRYRLLSTCPESTGRYPYNTSCSLMLPLLSGDSESRRRKAAIAQFQDRKTGKRFIVVSAHLDERHSSNRATEVRLNALRGNQIATITGELGRMNTGKVPVIFGGDINSWQANRIGHAPHDVLVSRGFFDTASARSATNVRYSTLNRFATVVKPSSTFGSRLDVIMVQRSRGANWFENKMAVRDGARPSDHNMVIADLVL